MVRIFTFISVVFFVLALLCACVSDKDKEDMRSMASSAMTSASSGRSSSYNLDIDTSRSDHGLSVPDDWTSSTGGGSNPDKYPWEDDKNIPDLDWNITPDSSGMVESEYNTGETGGTWEISEFSTSIP